MKSKINFKILLCLTLLLNSLSSIAQKTATVDTKQESIKTYKVKLDSLSLFDSSRNRLVPVALYLPNTDKVIPKQQVIIFSHGYGGNAGGDNVAYSYLTEYFASLGYFVASIQHELPTDEPMDLKGVPQVARKPNWEKGVQNILFVIKELKKTKPNLDFNHITLIGHSNGGDMVMLFATEYPELADKIISLDNRRMPFPRVKQPKIYSLRSSDQVADEGVLPTAEEQQKLGITLIKLNNTIHNDMDDHANEAQRKEINGYILGFLKSQK